MRSGTSLSSKLPDPPEWFLDRALGDRVVAEALRAHGLIVHVHRDHFTPEARDEEWLAGVGQHNWIVLTKDRMILRRPVEREALIRAKIRAFVLVAKETTGPENAGIFIRALPAMIRYVEQHPAPFIVRVYREGIINPVDLEKVQTTRRKPNGRREKR